VRPVVSPHWKALIWGPHHWDQCASPVLYFLHPHKATTFLLSWMTSKGKLVWLGLV
jgi:hypothetical protein